ncbi:MAG: hypothetical protein JHD16_06130 [Solirubrobacteraceae bacterium]|nr:hypothetical protein [Solirubrobacteraceae bacterium]
MNRSFRALAALAVCAGSLAVGATAAQAKTLDIVIAGDSYSSGVGGGGGYTGGACTRSPNTWGQVYGQLARNKGLTVNVNNVACGGGVVTDLDKQMLAVTPETDLVLVTIGGNDVGFANIVIQCFTPGISDPARCQSAIATGKRKVPGVQTAALKRLQALKARMRPGGKVVVMSYPYLANPSNYILRGLFNSFNAGKGARELGDLGDQTVINAGNLANAEAGYDFVTFVPVKDRFIGHEPNQDPFKTNSAGWIHEFNNLYGATDIYHPKPAGYRAMGEATMAKAGSGGDFGVSQ